MPTDDKDLAYGILTPASADDNEKAKAWDIFHGEADEPKFSAKLAKVNLPDEVKAQLWDAKFPQYSEPVKQQEFATRYNKATAPKQVAPDAAPQKRMSLLDNFDAPVAPAPQAAPVAPPAADPENDLRAQMAQSLNDPTALQTMGEQLTPSQPVAPQQQPPMRSIEEITADLQANPPAPRVAPQKSPTDVAASIAGGLALKAMVPTADKHAAQVIHAQNSFPSPESLAPQVNKPYVPVPDQYRPDPPMYGYGTISARPDPKFDFKQAAKNPLGILGQAGDYLDEQLKRVSPGYADFATKFEKPLTDGGFGKSARGAARLDPYAGDHRSVMDKYHDAPWWHAPIAGMEHVAASVGDMIDTFTSPKNIALMIGMRKLPPQAAMGVDAYFASSMMQHAPDTMKQGYEKIKNDDPTGWEDLMNGTSQMALAAGVAHSANQHSLAPYREAMGNLKDAMADHIWERGGIEDASGNFVEATGKIQAEKIAEEILKQNEQVAGINTTKKVRQATETTKQRTADAVRDREARYQADEHDWAGAPQLEADNAAPAQAEHGPVVHPDEVGAKAQEEEAAAQPGPVVHPDEIKPAAEVSEPGPIVHPDEIGKKEAAPTETKAELTKQLHELVSQHFTAQHEGNHDLAKELDEKADELRERIADMPDDGLRKDEVPPPPMEGYISRKTDEHGVTRTIYPLDAIPDANFKARYGKSKAQHLAQNPHLDHVTVEQWKGEKGVSTSLTTKTGSFESEKPAAEQAKPAAPQVRSVEEVEKDYNAAAEAGDRAKMRELSKELIRAQNAPKVEPRQQGNEVAGQGPQERNQPEQNQPQEIAPSDRRGIDRGGDRRENVEQRKRVGEMSPEEMKRALLTNDVTGLPNRRAFDEAPDRGAVGMSDADGLKAFNDRFGYENGNTLLRAKAEALKEAGLEAYHEKGDEFLHRGKSPEEVKQKLEKAREILRSRVIEVKMSDGSVEHYKGADFSYGAGTNTAEAEAGLHQHKEGREARGERARGELRGFTKVGPEKGEISAGASESVAPEIELDDELKGAFDDLAKEFGGEADSSKPLTMATSGKAPSFKARQALIKVGSAVYKKGITELEPWKKAVDSLLRKHISDDVADQVSDYLDETHEDVKDYHNEQSGNQSDSSAAAAESGAGGDRLPHSESANEPVVEERGAGVVRGTPEEQGAGAATETAGDGSVRPASADAGPGDTVRASDGDTGRSDGSDAERQSGRLDVDTDEQRAAREAKEQADKEELERHQQEARGYLKELLADHNSKTFFRHDPSQMGAGGEIGKTQGNITALRVLKKLREEDRLATPKEKETLSRFVGWGQTANVFNRYSDLGRRFQAELKSLLSSEAYTAASASITNAFYTSPEVVQAMWDAALKMGFKGGQILEPSMGLGYFFGMAPEEVLKHPDTRMVGIEKDDGTAGISQTLWGDHPRVSIIHSGIEHITLPGNSVPLVIGNPPFGGRAPYDPQYKKLPLLIHDYFIIKSLDALRPGGIAMLISTHGTLDKVDPFAREHMAARADLIDAYRLPETAFKQNAGTEVVADILIFRKRGPAEVRGGLEFKNAPEMDLGGNKIPVNEVFQKYPEKVIGKLSSEGGMYRPDNMTVKLDGDLKQALSKAMSNVPENVFNTTTEPTADICTKDATKKNYSYHVDKDTGALRQFKNGAFGAIDAELQKADTVSRIKGMIGVRDALNEYMDAQKATEDDAQLEEPRKALEKLYDRFVWKDGKVGGKLNHGFINDNQNFDAFHQDPEYFKIAALERPDEDYIPKNKSDRKTAFTKADIFKGRTVFPYKEPVLSPTDPHQWVAVSQVMRGHVDVPWLADKLGKPFREVSDELVKQNLAYVDPVTGEWIQHEEYLSGNVRAKLQDAKRALAVNPELARNVEALEKVQPTPLTIHEFDSSLGAMHVPMEAYSDFVQNHLFQRTLQASVHRSYRGQWSIDLGKNSSGNYYNTHVWGIAGVEPGSPGATGKQIIEDVLNMRPTTINAKDPITRKPYVDRGATAAARVMQERLRDEFNKWLRKDGNKHQGAIEKTYNDNFNGWRLLERDGSHLGTPVTKENGSVGYILPGMNPSIQLNPHQVNAVWHGIVDGRGYFNHEVGLGKTFVAGAVIMEAKRMGLARKGLYLSPKMLADPTAKQLQRLYPGASILNIRAGDLTGGARKQFAAMIATNDWDMVVMPYSAFKLTPVSPERMRSTIKEEIDRARLLLEGMKGDENTKKKDIKDVEDQIAALTADYNKLADSRKDDTVYIDELGVDMVLGDEAHYLKNLKTFTKMGRIKNVPSSNVKNQITLHFKAFANHLQEQNRNRGVYLMSGTPITNTMAELYNINRYIAPDILKDAGIEHFDDWVQNFGRVITAYGLKTNGMDFEPSLKLAKLKNVPELSSMTRYYMNVARVAQYPEAIKVPIADRKPIAVQLTPVQNDIMETIVHRFANMPKDKRIDNHLFAATDARKVSLDPRLYDHTIEDNPDYKVNVVAREVASLYKQHDLNKGTQLVFSEFRQNREGIHVPVLDKDGAPVLNQDGSPKMRKKYGKIVFDLHKELKDKLIAQGVPAEQIAVLSDYMGDSDKRRQARLDLYQAVRDGKVRVMIATRAMGGVGVNVQDRVAAIHHLDAPWTPERLEQSEGRAIRQGNMNPAVRIARYISVKVPDIYHERSITAQSSTVRTPDRVKMRRDVGGFTTREAPEVQGPKQQHEDFADGKIHVEDPNVGKLVFDMPAIKRVLPDDMYDYVKTFIERTLVKKHPAPFDAYMYDTVVTKQQLINQFFSGTLKDRELDDMAGEVELDQKTAAALASGNPDAQRRVELSYTLNALYAMEQSFQAEKVRARGDYRHRLRIIQDYKAKEAQLDAFNKKWNDRDTDFSAVVDGLDTAKLKELYIKKNKVAEADQGSVSGRKAAVDYLNERYPLGQPMHDAAFNFYGHDVPVRYRTEGAMRQGGWQYQFGGEWFDSPLSGAGLLAGFEQRAAGVATQLERLQEKLKENQTALKGLKEKMGETKSPNMEQIKKLQQELKEVNQRLGITESIGPDNLILDEGDEAAAEADEDDDTGDGSGGSLANAANDLDPAGFEDEESFEDERDEELGYTKSRLHLPTGNGSYLGPAVSRRSLVKMLMKLSGATHLGMGQKKALRNVALGLYMPMGENIRLKKAGDIPVLAHEVFHALNKKMWGKQSAGVVYPNVDVLRPYKKELYSVATPSPAGIPGGKLMEGFAEYGRMLVTDPIQAETKLPDFHEFFMKELDQPQFKEEKKLIGAVQQAIANFVNQADEEYVGAHISVGEGTAKKEFTFTDSLHSLYTGMLDGLHPLERATEEMASRMVSQQPLAAADNPYIRARLLKGVAGKVMTFFEHGIFDANNPGVPTGPPMRHTGEGLNPRELDKLRRYLVAKSSLEDAGRGLPTAYEDLGRVKSFVKDVEQNSPEIVKHAEAYRDYGRDGLLKYLIDSDVITKEQALDMERLNQFYASKRRLFDADERRVLGNTKGTDKIGSNPNPIKRKKGSTRDIIDPIESLGWLTYHVINTGERNKVALALARLSRQSEGSGKWVREIEPPPKVTTFRLEEIEKALDDAGFSGGNLKAIASIFRAPELPKNSNVISFVEGGKIKYLELDPELYRALQQLDHHEANWFVKVLEPGASLVRAGSTVYSPRFGVRHLIRQSLMATGQSMNGANPLDAIKGLFHAIKHDDLYWRAMASGAFQAADVSMDRKQLQKTLEKLMKEKPGFVLRHPFEVLRIANEFSDESGRIGEFVKALANGKDSFQAAFDARDAGVDAGRIGRWMRAWNRIAAFSNIGLQHTDSFFRAHKRNPRRAIITGAACMAISAIVQMMNEGNEKYEELEPWRKFMFWNIPTDGTPLEKWLPFIQVPKPFLWGYVYGSGTDAVYDTLKKKDPKVAAEYSYELSRDLMIGMPNMPITLIETLSNKSFLTGKPLVYPHVAAVAPHAQHYPYTSEISKLIANGIYDSGHAVVPESQWSSWKSAFEFSPIKIDHVLFGIGGAAVRDTSTLVDNAYRRVTQGKTPRSVADLPVGGAITSRWPNPQAQSITHLYERMDYLTEKLATDKDIRSEGKEPKEPFTYSDSLELGRLRGAAETMKDAHARIRNIEKDKDMSDADRTSAMDDQQLRAIRAAQNAIRK